MILRELAIAGALGAVVAIGLPQAKAQEADPRLVTRVYDATQIVRIHGRPGVQATIAFAEDERIENVAVGDSEKWQITPNKRANLLFARPLDPAAVTNMTVVTDKRTYLFDLVASVKDRPVYMLRFTYKDMAPARSVVAVASAAPQPVLAQAPQDTPPPVPRLVEPEPPRLSPAESPLPVLAEAPQAAPPATQAPAVAVASPPSPQRLAYRSVVDEAVGVPVEDLPVGQSGLRAEADKPGDPAPAPIARAKRQRQAKAKRVRNPEPAPQQAQTTAVPAIAPFVGVALPTEPGALNFAWIRKGKTALLPLRVYDDGRATYLLWGAKQTIPDVQVIGSQGEQVASQITRHESSVVILAVPSQIVLRAGRASATLDNLRQHRPAVSLAGASTATGATE